MMMKPKAHRGPRTSMKRKSQKKQPHPPVGRPVMRPYAQPYPVYFYPYPGPQYHYHIPGPHHQVPIHGNVPMTSPFYGRPEYESESPMPPLIPPAVGDRKSNTSNEEKLSAESDPSSSQTEQQICSELDSKYSHEEEADKKTRVYTPEPEQPAPAECDRVDDPSSDTESLENGRGNAGEIVPHENDVLLGRGGKNNAHSGNERLREMARDMREVYIRSRKKVKTEMALELVQKVFGLTPPGRFLQRDPKTMIWEKVDLEVARHKTSQCLRDAASEKPSAVGSHADLSYPSKAPVFQPSARASTPVRSNLANKIEISPQPHLKMVEASLDVPPRRNFTKWEPDEGAAARDPVECWENKKGSFRRHRRASLEPIPVKEMWESNAATRSRQCNVVEYLEVEDANMIPAEELDAVAEGMNSFSLFNESQLESEAQICSPDKVEEYENPFDAEFFYGS